uniref:Galectin n=1 Tax=Salvator merianae TaxID=96440 RepID=A0A8D0DQR5_SALMN
MEYELLVSRATLKPGDTVQVKGKILPDAKSFIVNLGKDADNIMLHFNPRFDYHGDVNTIVCNSKQHGVWGEETRETNFPFEQGGKVEVSFTFAANEIKVQIPEGHEFSFPNRLDLDVIEYLIVAGDFKIKALKFS